MREHGERVFGFADSLVERSGGATHATEIEAGRGVTQFRERSRERLRDLVVERSALQRMRMADERDALGRRCRDVENALDRADRPDDLEALDAARRQMRSLSTISPPMT